jgi:phage repressor protein C with HTH and peptisase S24 domain
MGRGKDVLDSLDKINRSVRWLARQTGLNHMSLTRWLSDTQHPRRDDVWDVMTTAIEEERVKISGGRIVEQLTLPPDPPKGNAMFRTKAEPTGKLKIYGAISAGLGNTSSIDAVEMDVPIQFARDDYGGLIIEGNSMEPFLRPSDVAIFRDWYAEKPGHVVAAQLGTGEYVAKFMDTTRHGYRLRSFNPEYPDILDNFRILGFLVGYIRDDGPERIIRLNPYGLKADRETILSLAP